MKRGFTLLELMVVVGIIAVLAGAMIPVFSTTREGARQARAIADADSIKSAALSYHYDTGEWPCPGNSGGLTCLVTRGRDYCLDLKGWNGPYLSDWTNDPWGYPYRVFDEVASKTIWAQSIGPNGVSDNCTGDDICQIIAQVVFDISIRCHSYASP